MDNQDRNAPLVLFTVLGPASVGLLLGALILGTEQPDGFTALAASGAFVLAAAAALASVAHLDKPLRAYRALRRFPSSPLSREIASFGAYGIVAAAYAAATLAGARVIWLGALGVVLGAAAVLATAQVYVIPGRPAWRHWSTVVSFAGCALSLGPALALALGGAWGDTILVGDRASILRSIMVSGVALSAVAFWSRTLRWSRVFEGVETPSGSVPGGSMGLLAARAAVGLVLPMFLVVASPTAPLAAAATALALLLGETADRTLFFDGTAPHPIGSEIPGAR